MLEKLQLLFYIIAILSGLLGIYAFYLNYVTNKYKKKYKKPIHTKKNSNMMSRKEIEMEVAYNNRKSSPKARKKYNKTMGNKKAGSKIVVYSSKKKGS